MTRNLPNLDCYDMADIPESEIVAYPDDLRDAWEAWTDFDAYEHTTA